MVMYWDSFGWEWTRWPTTQLYGKENDDTFTKKTGLRPDDVKGKYILDVGCGTGRFTEVVSRWGANLVCGADPSRAWVVAHENLKNRDNVRVGPVSIEEAKDYFSGLSYDIVYCIGVLHHTPNPKQSFLQISKLVKPGGLLCVWVYGKMGSWDNVAQIYRKVTVHLPWWMLRVLCYIAGPWDYVRRIPYIGNYLWLLFPCSMHPEWRWRVLDTFDWYSPKYQSKHTVEEVRGWFEEAGFMDVKECEIPVSVRGVRK